MRIGAIQCKAEPGDINANIESHLKFIQLADDHNVNLLYFPELSITGYEPKLSRSLAMTMTDPVLDIFKKLSHRHDMIIGIGMPLAFHEHVQIGMAWFIPNGPSLSYAKQQLHNDELPFFISGERQLLIQSGNHKFAPSICYESLQSNHADYRGTEKMRI